MRWFFVSLWLFCSIVCEARTEASAALALRGHLDKEKVSGIIEELDEAVKKDTDVLILEIGSASGDLYSVLEVAKRLYEIKQSKKVKVVAFLDDEVIGPAAIIPFLADDLYISVFVSWGDIPSGSETEIATNLLRSRVRSLIPDSHPDVNFLRLLADAMCDPSLEVVSDGREGRWRLNGKTGAIGAQVVSPKGETLVVNQNQLRQLKIIRTVMSLEDFRGRFIPVEGQRRELEEKEEEGPVSLAVAPEELKRRLEEHIVFDPQADRSIGRIVISDRSHGISESTWIYVKSALDHYKASKPQMIVLELNTPGGQVFAAQKISEALYEMDTQHHIPVIAFIDNWAISAGAMLAYSCRFIAVVKDASMGAAEPVLAAQTGKMEAASEKVNSAIRTDFGNRAKFFDRDTFIAQAMVDKDMVLVVRYGNVVKLNSNEEIRTHGPNPDRVITTAGKLLTLNGDELIEYGVADLLVPRVTLEPITPQEKSAGKWPASKSLLFQHQFLQKFSRVTIDSYQLDWKGQFFAILTHPAVSSLLFLGLMIGFYIEMSTPGFGVPGSVAVICLVLIVLSGFALEAAGWLEVILILLGAGLLAADILFIPTFGLLGITGIIFLIGGFFGLLLPGLDKISYDFDSQTLNAAGQVVMERLAWLCAAFILGLMVIAVMGRFLMPRLMIFSKLMLQGEEDASAGYVAGPAVRELPAVGDRGKAETTLRPAGKVVIGDVLYDAVSAGTLIEKGREIVVVAVEGKRIVVESEGKG